MTTTELITRTADRMIESPDLLDFMIDELRPYIAPHLFAELMLAIDFCPMHACDRDICADDDIAECADIR